MAAHFHITFKAPRNVARFAFALLARMSAALSEHLMSRILVSTSPSQMSERRGAA